MLLAWTLPAPRTLPWTLTLILPSMSMMKLANIGLYLRPSGLVRIGKPRSIQMLSLFKYWGCPGCPKRGLRRPGPNSTLRTSPPASLVGGKNGCTLGCGRMVKYFIHGQTLPVSGLIGCQLMLDGSMLPNPNPDALP